MYYREGELKAGVAVLLDGGFTCVPAGPVFIEEDKRGLYFRCNQGRHYIDGQLEDGYQYIGISPLPIDTSPSLC